MQALRIVSIEDEIDMIDFIRSISTQCGYEVFGAQGGREGLRVVQKQKSDLMMPDTDKWEVYAQLKADPSTQMIPVPIVMARAPLKDRLVLARQSVQNDDVSKSFSPKRLIESAKRLLAHQPGRD